jgi:hypothetical protein
MSRDWSDRLSLVNFRCGACKAQWDGVPDLIEDAPDVAHHPHRYFAHCLKCGAQNQPQAAWERALMKAHQEATGPKTAEGKAATARNLAGHPTPEEALRTRFNGMKHGMTARTATYFPARPDKYAFCSRCDVDRGYCREQPACVKQTELFMLHHAAFEQRDPKVLARLHGDLQASLTAMLQMCIQEVLGDGVIIRQPRVELDRNGTPVTLTYLNEAGERQYVWNYQSHPAFKPLTELVSRLGLSMNDLGMTVRAAEVEEQLPGRLVLDDDTRESLAAFSERMLAATAGAKDLIAQAQAKTKADPVLVEFQARGGEK